MEEKGGKNGCTHFQVWVESDEGTMQFTKRLVFGLSRFTSRFLGMEISAVEVLFVRRSDLVLALRLYGQADLSVRDRFSAAVAADNGAFEIGRPSGIGPTTSQQQVGNRTALDGSM